ncbi:uncharacterized protein LOC124371530 [Homalodisca vitripennis]|uniref:uncharacterized protein LOC124371530 n=1 Tax=Homalodisca vitripennis TaxID=197043 RepID=UPI001EEA0D7B|nr:uncharacterized protein LOC124371530 [Homalodisca vitripennis]
MGHRCDISLPASRKQSGGGALIAVRNGIVNRRLYTGSNIECVFVLVTVGPDYSILVACVYIPPSSPLYVYNDFCDSTGEAVELANQPKKLLIVGDFNLPHFDLSSKTTGLLRQASEHIKDMSALHSLYQINHVRNHRGVSLDLVFCSEREVEVIRANDFLTTPDIHHPPLALAIQFRTSALSADCYMGHNLWKCNLDSAFEDLRSTDMTFIYDKSSVDDKFNRLMKSLEDISLKASPTKKFGISHFPSWFSGELKRLIVKKKVAHKRYKRSLNLAHYYDFSKLRDTCRTMSRECYRHYLSNVESNISTNPRAFWGLVKAQRKSPDIPSMLHLDGEEATDSSSICQLFSTYFSSVYSPQSHCSLNHCYANSDCLCCLKLTREEVLLKLEHLDITKGAGLDNVPPSVIHRCRSLLVDPLTSLFNESLEMGIFPAL